MELLLNPILWLAAALAVTAVVIVTPRNKDGWYHEEAGFGKPYRGEQRTMGCTNALIYTALVMCLALATIGVFLVNFPMMLAAVGCLLVFLSMTWLAAKNDQRDAARDGIRVDYNRNGGLPGMLTMLAVIIIIGGGLTLWGLLSLIGR